MGPGGEDNGGSIELTRQEMASYYRELIGCMNAYTLEDFTSALRSCMTGDKLNPYIHINANRYYKIKPRQPFAINKEYMMDIPQAQLMQKSAVSTMDLVSGVILMVCVAAGLMWAALKVKLFEACTCEIFEQNGGQWAEGAVMAIVVIIIPVVLILTPKAESAVVFGLILAAMGFSVISHEPHQHIWGGIRRAGVN